MRVASSIHASDSRSAFIDASMPATIARPRALPSSPRCSFTNGCASASPIIWSAKRTQRFHRGWSTFVPVSTWRKLEPLVDELAATATATSARARCQRRYVCQSRQRDRSCVIASSFFTKSGWATLMAVIAGKPTVAR